MKAVIARKPLSLQVPNFDVSGYLGSTTINETDWQKAAQVARSRQSIAAAGDFQKVKGRDPAKQYLKDLKGALAEIGFGAHLSAIAVLSNADYETAALVADKPVAEQDITFAGLRFDIKGCAGLIEGRTEREDRLLIINCTQHDKKYDGYMGYFFVKSYEAHQDVFYYRRADVGEASGWTREPGKARSGDYYALTLPTVHKKYHGVGA
ncbi:MAG: hypothetical protein M3Y65_24795 [Pseudomonadota bacterium]|nr:hypothetical protein [Pseudomonadota bacterium]